MGFLGGTNRPDPLPAEPVGGGGPHEVERRVERSTLLASGTLACARCDAPVALAGGTVSLRDWLSCPFCSHRAPARDFLSLGEPTRPARVAVRVSGRRSTSAGSRRRARVT